MSLIHTLNAVASLQGVDAIQALQRDMSPYVAHFTSVQAMGALRQLLTETALDPAAISLALRRADAASWRKFRTIANAGVLTASRPWGLPTGSRFRCVCLSECTLPSLISHSERYGRFGFVFSKRTLAASGARLVAHWPHGTDAPGSHTGWVQPLGTTPAGFRDFSHEREWRFPENIDMDEIAPAAVLCPLEYHARVRGLLEDDVPVIPLDMLFEWGA